MISSLTAKKNIYSTKWSPKEYLKQYYTTGDIAQDEYGIFRFIIDFIKKKKVKFNKIIEIGCGPTIHHALPFVPYVEKIYLADYLKINLDEIRKWINNKENAHDWTPYLDGVLNMENRISDKDRKKRIHDLKNKIVKLLHCDVLSNQVLGRLKEKFELVTSFYCLECVARNKKEWNIIVKDVSNLIKPKGWVIIGSVHDTNRYKVGDVVFPVVRIKRNDIYNTLVANGYLPKTISIKVYPSSDWANEGFSSIIVCRAQKK